jgi:hypothetical protein
MAANSGKKKSAVNAGVSIPLSEVRDLIWLALCFESSPVMVELAESTTNAVDEQSEARRAELARVQENERRRLRFVGAQYAGLYEIVRKVIKPESPQDALTLAYCWVRFNLSANAQLDMSVPDAAENDEYFIRALEFAYSMSDELRQEAMAKHEAGEDVYDEWCENHRQGIRSRYRTMQARFEKAIKLFVKLSANLEPPEDLTGKMGH